MSIGELMAAGGVVMWPLLGCSLLTTVLILERSWFWLRLRRQQRALVQQALAAYQQNPAVALTQLQQRADLPVARIFMAALALPEATPDEFRLALESAAQAELPLLKRFHTVFETVIGISPLLGLLGTILGLIQALSSLQLGEVAGERTLGVTAGIGEALVSTATGLVIAIITLFFANLFQGLYRRQRAFIQEVGGQLEILQRRQYRQLMQPPADRRY